MDSHSWVSLLIVRNSSPCRRLLRIDQFIRRLIQQRINKLIELTLTVIGHLCPCDVPLTSLIGWLVDVGKEASLLSSVTSQNGRYEILRFGGLLYHGSVKINRIWWKKLAIPSYVGLVTLNRPMHETAITTTVKSHDWPKSRVYTRPRGLVNDVVILSSISVKINTTAFLLFWWLTHSANVHPTPPHIIIRITIYASVWEKVRFVRSVDRFVAYLIDSFYAHWRGAYYEKSYSDVYNKLKNAN